MKRASTRNTELYLATRLIWEQYRIAPTYLTSRVTVTYFDYPIFIN